MPVPVLISGSRIVSATSVPAAATPPRLVCRAENGAISTVPANAVMVLAGLSVSPSVASVMRPPIAAARFAPVTPLPTARVPPDFVN